MRRALAILAPFFIVACATTSTTPAPSADATPPVTPSTAATPVATIEPTEAPSATPIELPTPAPTPVTASTEPGPTLPPAFGVATLTTTGAAVPNSDVGGCGSLWLADAIYGQDDCGPNVFNLTAEPVVVAPGGVTTFAAPAGYSFSVDRIAPSPDAAGFHSWTVKIAPISALASLPLGQQEAITPEHGGRTLGYGDRAVISAWVKAPTQTGEYLVELDASVNLGPWTFTWPEFFWRVSVQ
jgi:hypothetical protein